MYFLIITFGLLLAMRGERPTSLQNPVEGLKRIGRDALDLFLTAGLILMLGSFAGIFEMIRTGVQEYAILSLGVMAYLLSRYQKKPDIFFFTLLASVFLIHLKQPGPMEGLWMALEMNLGIAIFRVCFLGLRYRLLFSRVPVSMKGWPVLCLLAGFISVVLWSFKGLTF